MIFSKIMAKITKKRNYLRFCNYLPCNYLYVSTVHTYKAIAIARYTVETYKSLHESLKKTVSIYMIFRV